jgi:hypothetical protein
MELLGSLKRTTKSDPSISADKSSFIGPLPTMYIFFVIKGSLGIHETDRNRMYRENRLNGKYNCVVANRGEEINLKLQFRPVWMTLDNEISVTADDIHSFAPAVAKAQRSQE